MLEPWEFEDDEEEESGPVLDVDIINFAYRALIAAYDQKLAATLGRIELEKETYNLVEGATEVKILEAKANTAVDIAKAEVDCITAIQQFFQIASLNNLSEK